MIREPRFPYDPSFFRFISFQKLYQNIQYKNKKNIQKQKGGIIREPWFPYHKLKNRHQ